ncbi:bacteriocin immunity protein [Enterococcus lactis]|uniref:bacteriocin immunity protein n=1 Tax=Enterococcus lactis TaxID=357441 RepID=UPI002412C4A7|nr:bacteriocin immunity protein [Enterococcus lactis]
MIITELLDDLETDLGNDSLRMILHTYLGNLKNEGTSVPLILSRMNLEISNAIKKDGVSLNAKQSKKLKELMSISNIRYGY